VPDGSQWLASGTLYSKNMLISGKNRAVASTYFKADATAPRALCRVTAQSSPDCIGETRSGLSPRVAALTSGMVGKSQESPNTILTCGDCRL